ncbi:membrane protein [Streptomyces amakusaensis]|uniref:Large membrane protein n=1 Tax=Streptomyces amakusaensis TaxID=67271 RepID=A0ABW0AFC7_9ACTN
MSSTENTHDGPPRRRPRLIAAVAAAVLIAGGGSAYFASAGFGASGDGGRADAKSGAPDSTPPRLGIGSGERDGGRIAPGEPDPSGGPRYTVEGELPAGPERAPVHRATGTVSGPEVARLAEALELPGTPRSAGPQWTIGASGDGADPVLRVDTAAPGSWTYSLSPGGDNCRGGKECPELDSTGDTGTPPDERTAKEAAAPVLKALGQDGAKLDARQTIGSLRVVNADPVVGGLATYGWSTDLQIDADGRVVRAAGNLKPPVRGEEYPVLSAAETLERLNAGPGADSAVRDPRCAPRLPGGGGGSGHDVPCGPRACASAVPLDGGGAGTAAVEEGPCEAGTAPAAPPAKKVIKVTGASFALSAQYADGRPVLVPSWLFRAEPGGSMPAYTVAEPAVEPAFLREPSVPPKDVPSPESPSAEAPATGDGRILSYSAEGRALTVTFWGGVCGEYRVTAAESGDRVRVRIIEPEQKPGEACIALAKEIRKTVTLEKPLGGREVVDADSGEKVARASG